MKVGFRFHRHSLWGKRVVQIIQYFLGINGPNCFGAGAKNVQMLEPEPKNLLAWSWSLKFENRLHSPAFGHHFVDFDVFC